MATGTQNADLTDLFDFNEATMTDAFDETIETAPLQASACLIHPEAEDCLCHESLDDFTIDPAVVEEAERQFNSDFSSFIPRYSKPAHPCDYCGPRKLDCFFTFEGAQSCSSCSALFRPCSFTMPEDQPARPNNVIDTLHVVSEDVAVANGGMTSTKPLRSKYLGRSSRPSTPTRDDQDRGRKVGARFSKEALKVLKDWMEEHRGNPYPTEDEKQTLTQKTGLSSKQINDWMANTRRREKNKMPKRAVSPSVRPSTEAVDVPEGRTWNDLNPFERWKHSPPENEPAPMQTIIKNIREFSPPISSASGMSSRPHGSSTSGSHSALIAPSTTSFDTGSKISNSGISTESLRSHGSGVWSHGSRRSMGSFGSFGSNQNKDRRRRRRATAKPQGPGTVSARIFQCTFCTDRFKSKYDWSRHEKSLHLSLEKWICAPLGSTVTTTLGEKRCAYCHEINPSEDHIESHNHAACKEKGIEARTFYRKDHLRQHLRLMHNCKMTETMETWKSEATNVRCRCGFCGQEFTRWQDRADHIAKEFKNGARMKDWRGCRGLDQHIATLVTNAMPPYLIDNESKSPLPFSASNTASMKHHAVQFQQPDLEAIIPTNPTLPIMTGESSWTATNMQPFVALGGQNKGSKSSSSSEIGPATTCWEFLTIRLGKWAQDQIAQGIIPTDAMIQQKARYILYDDDDTWNQTAADNPDWLALFKKAHGIVDVPPNFDRRDALEDLGMLGLTNVDPVGECNPVDVAQWKEQSQNLKVSFEGGYKNLGDFYRSIGQEVPPSTATASTLGFQYDLMPTAGAGDLLSQSSSMGMCMGSIPALSMNGTSPSVSHSLVSPTTQIGGSQTSGPSPGTGEHEAFQLDEDLFADMNFDNDFDMMGTGDIFSNLDMSQGGFPFS